MAEELPTRGPWGRLVEELAYLVRGPKPGGRWHDGHACIAAPHDHGRCTHRICEELGCDAEGCHVVEVPERGTLAYEWQHHPIFHAEILERRRKLEAGGITLREYKRQLWSGRRAPKRR